ncbi:hypothetical protein HDV00_008685 [Rhizophlyctis rosea]|nr:hypothetical protein HDV00_008685 [Rhizophlyctis rosea]
MFLLGTSVLLVIGNLILSPTALILWMFHKHATRQHNSAWILQGRPINLLRDVPGATLTSSWKTAFQEKHWQQFSLYSILMFLIKFMPILLPLMIRDGHNYGYGLPEAGSVLTWKTSDLEQAAELDEALALGETTGAALYQAQPATFGAGNIGKRMYRGFGPQIRPNCRNVEAGDWDEMLNVQRYFLQEDQDTVAMLTYLTVGCNSTTATGIGGVGCPDWLTRYTKGIDAELVCFRDNKALFEEDVKDCFGKPGVELRAVSVGNLMQGNLLTTHIFSFSSPAWSQLLNRSDWDRQPIFPNQPVLVSMANTVTCNFTSDIAWNKGPHEEVEPRALLHFLEREPPTSTDTLLKEYQQLGWNIVSSYLLASTQSSGIWVSTIQRAGTINALGQIYFLLVGVVLLLEGLRILFWRLYTRNMQVDVAMPLDHRACMITLLWEQLDLGMGCNADVTRKLEDVKLYGKHYFGLTERDLGLEHLGTGHREKMVSHAVGAHIQGEKGNVYDKV